DVSGAAAVPRWNFHKLLIGRDGRLIEPFASSVTPDAPVLRSAVEQALSNSSPGTASVKR
ncbi:MAG TPA: glutathione peroxidase, partial [Azospirillum sp.]|nr:glutathione peroxidase [Azospirillum sp.]